MKTMSYAKLLDKINYINTLYTKVRIVDFVKGTVFTDGKELALTLAPEGAENSSLHDHWKKGLVCANSISVHAYNEGQSFIKKEYSENKPYTLTALPVTLDDRTLILELLTLVESPQETCDFSNSPEQSLRNILDRESLDFLTDPLTRLCNKQYIYERLPHDILKNFICEKAITLVMADIDYFKKVNQYHGHEAGDFILEKLAGLLKNFAQSESDWVARFGGEEFLIILNATDSDSALESIEKLRQSIENEDNIYQGKDIKITCSFGMHTLNGDEIDVESFIQRADRNLYAAKEAGRNKIVRN